MPRRSRSRGRGRSRSYRGGAGAANPSSYSSAATYMQQTVGGTNQQYDNVLASQQGDKVLSSRQRDKVLMLLWHAKIRKCLCLGAKMGFLHNM